MLLDIVAAVAADLHPDAPPGRVTLDSVLDRELGIDSLGRVEVGGEAAEVAVGAVVEPAIEHGLGDPELVGGGHLGGLVLEAHGLERVETDRCGVSQSPRELLREVWDEAVPE